MIQNPLDLTESQLDKTYKLTDLKKTLIIKQVFCLCFNLFIPTARVIYIKQKHAYEQTLYFN